MKKNKLKELSDIYKLAHRYNFDDFCQFMAIEPKPDTSQILSSNDN